MKKRTFRRLLASAAAMSVIVAMTAKETPVYLDDSKSLEERVEDALSRMTTEEKIAIIHAHSKFGSPGVKRLGIPEVWTDDGPHGVRLDVLWDEWEILVVGENAVKMMTVGGGNSSLKVQHEISPLDGIRAAAPEGCTVAYARGYVGDIGGEYNGVTSGQDLSDNRSPEELIADAVSQAKDADVAIFIGGLNKAAHQDCEDSDRFGLIGKDALSYFDADKHEWVAEPGEFKAHAAASSADIRSTVSFRYE